MKQLRYQALVASRLENFENYTRKWGAHMERAEDNRLAERVIQ
jgi:hypothetical protein